MAGHVDAPMEAMQLPRPRAALAPLSLRPHARS